MNKRILIISIFFFSVIKVTAQSDISMETHWYNRASYNPASIVRPDFIYFFTNARKQWTGLNGSPVVFNFQVSGYNDNLRSAFGFSLINDKIGLTKVTNPSIQYAHMIGISKEMYLSMGLSAGVFVRTLNASGFEAETVLDPLLTYADQVTARPDANLGFELQSKYFFAGISTTHLFSMKAREDKFLYTNHRYGYAYYRTTNPQLFNLLIGAHVSNRYNLTVFEVHSMIRFKYPTGLLKGPRELFDIGVTWRSTKQLTLLLGINVSADFRVGYAYDFDFVVNKDKKGTHEFILEYRIPVISKNSDPETDWYF